MTPPQAPEVVTEQSAEVPTAKRFGWPVWVATAGGPGFFPVAPGTLGAAVGLIPVVLLRRYEVSLPVASLVLALLAVVIFLGGVWAARRAERFFGRIDPGQVVIDEVAGQIVAFLAWPEASGWWLLAGFLLFRLFDVVKPFPARRAEHLPGGWGIMTDDVMAGIYTAAALWLAGTLVR
jgi:phosphatidylglycerophosphatase A